MLPAIPRRDAQSHKGTFGRGLVLGGCVGMAGAAAMCAEAALRSGAGLITIGAPHSVVPVLAAKTTCPTTHPFAETEAGSFAAHALLEVIDLLPGFTAVALGPGIGRHPSTCWFVLNVILKLGVPAVIDADGLNSLATDIDVLDRRHAPLILTPLILTPLILTPHPGEMARLAGISPAAVQADRIGVAEAFAARHRALLVLKGHGTVVTDGERTYVNTTGNPGMATGGAGDVLTGVILGLLCQQFEPFAAAQLGAYIHGLAGDIAARTKGETALIATDILDALPEAFRQYSGES